MAFRETKVVLLVVDLAGYSRATGNLEALQVAAFLEDWYRRCALAVQRNGGRVVKFMGDACFAVFAEKQGLAAIEAAQELERGMDSFRSTHQVKIEVGANVHQAIVAEGEIGLEGDRRYDVFGSGVNHLFMMGGAAGVRISEPVYRQLPNPQRGPWKKSQPPATYSLGR